METKQRIFAHNIEVETATKRQKVHTAVRPSKYSFISGRDCRSASKASRPMRNISESNSCGSRWASPGLEWDKWIGFDKDLLSVGSGETSCDRARPDSCWSVNDMMDVLRRGTTYELNIQHQRNSCARNTVLN